ncbi:hypothetical protein Dimus_008655 [Dionaea muscipula]
MILKYCTLRKKDGDGFVILDHDLIDAATNPDIEHGIRYRSGVGVSTKTPGHVTGVHVGKGSVSGAHTPNQESPSISESYPDPFMYKLCSNRNPSPE